MSMRTALLLGLCESPLPHGSRRCAQGPTRTAGGPRALVPLHLSHGRLERF